MTKKKDTIEFDEDFCGHLTDASTKNGGLIILTIKCRWDPERYLGFLDMLATKDDVKHDRADCKVIVATVPAAIAPGQTDIEDNKAA